MEPPWEPLPRAFFARDAHVVARELLGHLLVHHPPGGEALAARVVEAEAYFGPPGAHPHLAAREDLGEWGPQLAAEGDPASHAHRGVTERTRVMFGPPGHAYVYLIYGVHNCLNVSTGDGAPEAVLIRAAEPVKGAEAMRAARGVARDRDVASGPGKLTQALGVTRAHNGLDMTAPPLHFARGEPAPPEAVRAGPRVGVVGGEALPLRFRVAGNPHVSRPR